MTDVLDRVRELLTTAVELLEEKAEVEFQGEHFEEEFLDAVCPFCAAPLWWRCRSKRNARSAPHLDRIRMSIDGSISKPCACSVNGTRGHKCYLHDPGRWEVAKKLGWV